MKYISLVVAIFALLGITVPVVLAYKGIEQGFPFGHLLAQIFFAGILLLVAVLNFIIYRSLK